MTFSILEQSIWFTSWMNCRNEINEFQNTIQHHFQLTLTLTFQWHLVNVLCEFIRCLKNNSQNHSHTPNYIEIYAFCGVVATDSLIWYGENDVGLPENRATMGMSSNDAFHAYDKPFKAKWLWWFLAAKTLTFRVSPTQIRTENVENIPSHLVLNLYLTFNCLHLQLNKTKCKIKSITNTSRTTLWSHRICTQFDQRNYKTILLASMLLKTRAKFIWRYQTTPNIIHIYTYVPNGKTHFVCARENS